jgi:hypothetical protein
MSGKVKQSRLEDKLKKRDLFFIIPQRRRRPIVKDRTAVISDSHYSGSYNPSKPYVEIIIIPVYNAPVQDEENTGDIAGHEGLLPSAYAAEETARSLDDDACDDSDPTLLGLHHEDLMTDLGVQNHDRFLYRLRRKFNSFGYTFREAVKVRRRCA